MPSRRDLLRTCGPALSLGVGGCLGTGDRRGGTRTTTTETTRADAPTPTPATGTDTTTGTRAASETDTAAAPPTVSEVDPATVSDRGVPRSPTIESDRYEPFRAFVVGERPESPGGHYETPHVWVWNLTGDPTTVGLVLTAGGTQLRRITDEFPTGAPLALAFRDRGAYEVAVRAGDREETVAVERDRFRCNATATDVLVRSDAIETETVSTSLACTTTAGGS